MAVNSRITLIAAVGLAAVSGYFSVSGMASVYAGSAPAVIAIFIAIECGKLANAAFLHANWRRLGAGLKAGLSILLLATMALTSAGVYGQLTHSFLQATPARVAAENQVKILRATVNDLDRQIEALDRPAETAGLAKAVALRGSVKLAANLVSGERRDAQARSRDRAERVAARKAAGDELAAAEVTLASHEVELGPALSLASLAGLSADQAIKLLTLIATLCLDPLAVMLVMAASGARSSQGLPPRKRAAATTRRRRSRRPPVPSNPRIKSGETAASKAVAKPVANDNVIALARRPT